MQEKLNAIVEELEALKEQVAELEDKLSWLEDNCIDVDSGWDAISLVRNALEFSDLDNIQEYSEENVIILHTNCFRTVALANAYKAPSRWNMHELTPKELTAELLQENIRRANNGDYFLLKESQRPAIIVECGYLSNVNEEALLNDGDYQSKVAYAIMCGVVKYFDLCGND